PVSGCNRLVSGRGSGGKGKCPGGKVYSEVGDHSLDRVNQFSIRCDLARGYVVDVVLELLCGLKQCDGSSHVLDVQEIYRIICVTKKYVLEARRSSAYSRMNETCWETELCTVKRSEHSH